ncbi:MULTISPECIES: hypothetical protein [unclassified Halomonas]|uniref:hypothetical protein n=1 Tax=unclassified Halomonas TaxID=2609666 RepID=UPI002076BCFA|nr:MULTISPECIES: hypothetical protein [unclassified Halomonas]
MAPLQSLAQGSMFWQPDHVEASPWLDHLPWVFWLMETMRPRRCVTLGARPGSPHLALCQAAMRIDPDTECLLVSDDSETRDIAAAAERRYGGCHRLISASPARAAKRMQSGIDILALDLAGDDENMDLVLERWLELMSDQGVVLLSGINGGDASPIHYELFVSLQERYRSLSFHHGDGLGVVVVGSTPPELIETLLARWKTPSAARAVRDVFARLGRGVADQAVSDQHKAKLSHVQQQFEDVVQERDATSERAEKLRQTLNLNEQALAKLSEENRLLDEKLADAHGELKANNDELASVRKTLAETQSTLEESNARNAALEAMVAEKDANISTRFNELAILTDMLEEADKKRDALEQKAARLFERNEEKKRDAKAFRRQLAKAETRDAQRKDEIHELRESVNASEAAYGDATAREHEALMQVSKLQDKLQERDQELADRFEELGDLTAAMEAREAELEALTLKLAEAAQPKSAEPSQPRPVGKSSKRLGKKAEQRKLQTAIAEVEASQWFDAQWYLQQYPDIASDDNFNRRPAFHYVKFGGFEGRNPSPHFDSAAYLQTYPDVVATGINPLVHYLRDGIREERLARPHDAGSDTKFGAGEST